jgi:carbamoyltransferase
MNKPWVLGISASHNGALCLLHGDEIVVSVQEERLVRRKRSRIHGARSSLALTYCLQAAGIRVEDLSMIVLAAQNSYRQPENDLSLHPELRTVLHRIPTAYLPHHFAHAMSAYATSGQAEAAVLVVDGMGSPFSDLLEPEQRVARGAGGDGWEVLSTYLATPKGLEPIDKHLVPGGRWLIEHADQMWGFRSLGGMFSAVAQQLFGDPMEAGKVMGLAPYGVPSIGPEQFLALHDGLLEFRDDVPKRFRQRGRWPSHESAYAELAASTQQALEFALLELTRRLRQEAGLPFLCYAGGVALNGIANQRILRERVFSEMHVIPAAEDSGVAIGAAYWGLSQLVGEVRGRKQMSDAFGRSYTSTEVDDAIARTPMLEVVPHTSLVDTVVDWLCKGEIGGWFQGGSELGPRALGQRSILCDPRRTDAKDTLNRRVKHREAFRPFAPVLGIEHVAEWFDLEGTPAASPFMLRVCQIREDRRALVPGVTHVDGSGRLQTIEPGNPLHELLRAFGARTGVPLLVNTSFNVMGEPIVETPEDALWCLLSTGLDFCVLEGRLVRKAQAYCSLLDLVPRVIARQCSVDLELADGQLQLRTGPELRFVVATPWGETKQVVAGAHLQLLQMLSEGRTGWQLLELGGASNEDALVRELILLRRLRVIGLVPLGGDAAMLAPPRAPEPSTRELGSTT